jgi:hypothetical protein
MSPSQFSSESGQYDDTEIITLYDEEGRSLDCYIENTMDYDRKMYLLLMPIDLTIVILTEDLEEEDSEYSEYSETVMLEDGDEIDQIFDDAKAVLAELNLYLKRTAFTLTATGELPPLEENNIISLELEERNSEIEPEELQFLASFYHLEQKYNICTPLTPILFVAKRNPDGEVEMLKGDEEELQWILEELLFEQYDDN